MADQPTQKAKRRVKNPETFRERAIRAADAAESEKPRRVKRFTGGLGGTIFGPLVKAVRQLLAVRALKPVRRLFSLVGKIVFPVYFRRSWTELRLVTWPSWRESRRLTFAVLIFAIVFGAAVASVDYGLDKVFKNLLLK